MPEHFRRTHMRTVRAALDGRADDLRELVVQAGFPSADTTLTADQVNRWWAEILHELLRPRPVTFTRDNSRRAVRALIPFSPGHPVRQMALADDVVFMSRISLNVNAICGILGSPCTPGQSRTT
ncbi:hypothetical protein MLAC_22870 [Mycobacterium lacus]|uniref:Uncharacterized protein n=1 Tax=Mycobacterium lacus TaxID=169765 RepID=A0A7I7NL36_9MYCO|nr:hypothetical protein MLAC_22870 [Mycobacterium lacus]